MKGPSDVSGLVGAALGVIALVLPFTDDIAPFRVLSPGIDLWAQMLAGASLLAIPLLGWQLRRLGSSPPRPIEIAVAYVLSSAAMLPAIYWSGRLAWDSWGEMEEVIGCAGLLACWGLVACNATLLYRNTRRGVVPHVSAEAFLLGAYLPNAVFALVLFYPYFGGPEKDPNIFRHVFIFMGWSIGAYVVLAACIAFVVRIAVLLKSPESYRRPPGAGTDAPQAAGS